MNAEIIAVGSELLTPKRIDTNSLWLTERLNELGVEVTSKTIVGDDRRRLTDFVSAAIERSDIVLLTGGLGPTEDDVTREAVAQALGRGMVFREDICAAIEERFRRMSRKMAEINRRQAFVIEGAEALPNPNGTAPGLWLTERGRAVALLPGPPPELKPMFEQHCLPRLKELVPPLVIRTLQFRVAGMPESDLDQLISPVYKRYSNPVTTILAAPGDIQIHLRARCATEGEAQALLKELGPQIEALLGDRVYSRDGAPLEVVVGRRLRERGAMLAVAESCTGGELAARLTSVPGSSDYFAGGFLVYTAEMKASLLGVPPELMAEHGVVSEEVARAMAEGARRRTGAGFALSVTGYAGPATGEERAPVGTVCIGLAQGEETTSRRFLFPGDRGRVRALAAQTALDLLRRALAAP